MCVSPRYLVFHSLVDHVLHDDQLRFLLQVTAHVLRPQTIGTDCGAEGYRSVRLSVGQALPASRYVLLLYFSASPGWPLLDNERTPVVSFFFRHASKLIYEEDIYSSPRFRTCSDFLYENFLAKVGENFRKLLRVIFFTENSMKFLRKFEQELSRKFRDPFLPRKFP